ncbi:hypothetical protein [Priestia megaterium]|uniref:hypothetical protein n=1 Tax=Priestia megaterium TaxID=1404 RepID=UPI000EB7228A|nr:hypothetical protein [Priestia megaterium]AYE53899.1 hypothetical protein OEA_30255 [Priestia megaterium NCT-2]NGY80319.1 hypothetical protein [Priestia megaterium]USL39777.1 hypothetical protein LIT34_31325 [Priestia megaterium]USL39820.1 hypothetical protein LIT34_31605 [Priestia megaterium]
MSDYFEEVMRKLTIEDVSILGWLFQNEANAVFKAIKKSSIADEFEYSTANFRKTLNKLEAIHFIGTVTGGKEHKLYLTEYGQQAVQQAILQGEENEGLRKYDRYCRNWCCRWEYS